MAQERANLLPATRAVATLLTRVEVDPRAPAFNQPSKPIGPVYSRPQAAALGTSRQWVMVADGDGWRRVVPSPRPLRVPGLGIICGLLARAVLVIAGGGGIPVMPRPDGHGLQGVVR